MLAAVLAGFLVGVAVEAADGVGGEVFFGVEFDAIGRAADGFLLALARGD